MKSVEVLVEELEENRKAQEALKVEEADKVRSELEVRTTKPMKESGLEVHRVEPVIQKTMPAEEPEKKIKAEELVIEEPVIEEPVKAEKPVIEKGSGENENPKKESALDKFLGKILPPWFY